MHTPFLFLLFPLNLFLVKLHVVSDDGICGIFPDSLLLSNRSRVNWTIPCNSGMSPFTLLELISSDLNDVSWEISAGIDENWLVERLRFCRTESIPISVGMFPDRLFADKDSSKRFVICPICVVRPPCIWFESTLKDSKFTKLLKVSGTCPVKALLAKFRFVSSTRFANSGKMLEPSPFVSKSKLFSLVRRVNSAGMAPAN
mmetsp:Transcript_21289/g.52457  ORF Transcript_21289/g.52457 Transcript_21289/m.52457 type:complete len:201 (+) Transcript_21289:161-763(+)